MDEHGDHIVDGNVIFYLDDYQKYNQIELIYPHHSPSAISLPSLIVTDPDSWLPPSSRPV